MPSGGRPSPGDGPAGHGARGTPIGDSGGGSSRFGAMNGRRGIGTSRMTQSRRGTSAKEVMDKRSGRTRRAHSAMTESLFGNRLYFFTFRYRAKEHLE